MHLVTLLRTTLASKIAVLGTFLILYGVNFATPIVLTVKEIQRTAHLVLCHCTEREQSVLKIVIPVINRHLRLLFVLLMEEHCLREESR